MANAKNVERKAEQVSLVSEKIKRAQSIVFFDYRSITVAEDTALRAEMRKVGVEYMVIKNHIMGRACKEAGIEGDASTLLKGTNAFAFGYGDISAAARILKSFVKKSKKCEIVGGILEGNVINAEQMDEIAEMPSREVLLARLLGAMLSPITKFAIVLDQIAKKQGGEETQAE